MKIVKANGFKTMAHNFIAGLFWVLFAGFVLLTVVFIFAKYIKFLNGYM